MHLSILRWGLGTGLLGDRGGRRNSERVGDLRRGSCQKGVNVAYGAQAGKNVVAELWPKDFPEPAMEPTVLAYTRQPNFLHKEPTVLGALVRWSLVFCVYLLQVPSE